MSVDMSVSQELCSLCTRCPELVDCRTRIALADRPTVDVDDGFLDLVLQPIDLDVSVPESADDDRIDTKADDDRFGGVSTTMLPLLTTSYRTPASSSRRSPSR